MFAEAPGPELSSKPRNAGINPDIEGTGVPTPSVAAVGPAKPFGALHVAFGGRPRRLPVFTTAKTNTNKHTVGHT